MLFNLLIEHVQLLDIVLLKSLNFSDVPFNTTNSALDGTIVGRNLTRIRHYPHQLKLLNCC